MPCIDGHKFGVQFAWEKNLISHLSQIFKLPPYLPAWWPDCHRVSPSSKIATVSGQYCHPKIATPRLPPQYCHPKIASPILPPSCCQPKIATKIASRQLAPCRPAGQAPLPRRVLEVALGQDWARTGPGLLPCPAATGQQGGRDMSWIKVRSNFRTDNQSR